MHPALVVLGVPEPIEVDMEEFDARDGWILEIRIDQQGGTEVIPLLVHPLLSHILSSAHSHGFLRSVDIIQESSSGSGEKDLYEPSSCGYATDM